MTSSPKKRLKKKSFTKKKVNSVKILQHIEIHVRLRMPEFEVMLLLPSSIRKGKLLYSDLTYSEKTYGEKKHNLTS